MKEQPDQTGITGLSTEALLTSSEADIKANTYKIGFFITLPVFMAYACCFALQKHLSTVFGLTEGVTGDKTAILFGIATSFVYFFNLIFRVFGHNLVFACLSPRNRVIAALISAMISTSLLSFVSLYPWKKPPSIAWAFIAYAMCGVNEGSFGPNMLNVVNHLGNTRLYVILAMPTGTGIITMFAFAMIALGCPYQVFYLVTAALALIAIVLYLFTIYKASLKIDCNEHQFDLCDFCHDLGQIGQWFPKIWFHSIIFLVNMVCLALFNPGCTLYAYQSRVTFRIFGFTIDHDWFIFFYNSCAFLGDFFSRRVMEKKRFISPILFFVLLVFSFIINISLIPDIAPIAAFGFMWANGGLYSQCTKYIGQIFTEKYHLTATSTWLFIGDIGSTGGSNLVQFIRSGIANLKSKMY